MQTIKSTNERLVSRNGSRHELDTPCLCIDLDALEQNITKMAEYSRDHGVSLRPHAKTHKSVEIARRQQKEGAIGICCATVGEAEVMVEAGLSGVLITSPVVSDARIARIFQMLERVGDGAVMVVVDNPTNAEALAEAAVSRGLCLDVVVDCGAGLNRTGVASAEAAARLGAQVLSSSGIQLVGVQHYSGHLQHIGDRQQRRAEAARAIEGLKRVLDAVNRFDVQLHMITGSGTGTFNIDSDFGIFTEFQVGSYIFMDVDYNNVFRASNEPNPFETALFVQTMVVSDNLAPSEARFVTTDAGLKAFATDGPNPEIIQGGSEGSEYLFFGDEHGKITLPHHINRPLRIGDRLECATPHCDPTVNLYDWFHVLRGDVLVDIWPVDARGLR